MEIKTIRDILRTKNCFTADLDDMSQEWVMSVEDAEEAAKEYATQFIELAAEIVVVKGRYNKNLVAKEKEELLKQLK